MWKLIKESSGLSIIQHISTYESVTLSGISDLTLKIFRHTWSTCALSGRCCWYTSVKSKETCRLRAGEASRDLQCAQAGSHPKWRNKTGTDIEPAANRRMTPCDGSVMSIENSVPIPCLMTRKTTLRKTGNSQSGRTRGTYIKIQSGLGPRSHEAEDD